MQAVHAGVVLCEGRGSCASVREGQLFQRNQLDRRRKLYAHRSRFLLFDGQHRADAVRRWNGGELLGRGNVHCVP